MRYQVTSWSKARRLRRPISRIAAGFAAVCLLCTAAPEWCFGENGSGEPASDEVRRLRKDVEELKKQVDHMDKHLIHRPETRSMARLLDGLEIGFGLTGIVQGSGGAEDPVGRDHTNVSGSLDFEVQTHIGERGTAFVLVESREGKGLTDEIAPLHGVNADAVDDDGRPKVTEAWYEHTFPEERFLFTIGKVDLTNYFDTNAVANDEALQFLADGFVNNIAVAFPEDNGPGARFAFRPVDSLEIALGVAESDADFEDAARDPFAILESSYRSEVDGLEGNYRIYAWINASNHEAWQDPTRDDEKNWGFGFSLDQAFSQAFTGFFRAGIQDETVSQVHAAFSLGGEYRGLLPGRDRDVFGAALGYARLSGDYEAFVSPVKTRGEQMAELYYTIHMNEHLRISPDIQVIRNPSGLADADTIFTLGLRAQVLF